jgi:hypothetical protein
MLKTATGRTLPKYPKSTNQISPRWMRGRGMTIVLVPNFGRQLIERFARHVAAVGFELIKPDRQFVAFILRKRENIFF